MKKNGSTESDTRRRIREMTAAGMRVREIALALGISTQRVYAQLKKINAA